MQLYALDKNSNVISAKNASKRYNYKCLECQSDLRLRGGHHRQNHFYHIDPKRSCRQNGKSMEHLQVQLFLQEKLTEGDSVLENRFPEINRIADVVWISKKIVFEVQCSPITIEEVKQRNEDYAKAGFSVIWILHDKRYNKFKLSAAEMHLQSLPHYFTNMDANGCGIIYDRFRLFSKGKQAFATQSFTLSFPENNAINHHNLQEKKDLIPDLLLKKIHSQNLSFKGDLADYCTSEFFAPALFEKVLHLEKPKKTTVLEKVALLFEILLARPYRIFLRFLLEKASA